MVAWAMVFTDLPEMSTMATSMPSSDVPLIMPATRMEGWAPGAGRCRNTDRRLPKTFASKGSFGVAGKLGALAARGVGYDDGLYFAARKRSQLQNALGGSRLRQDLVPPANTHEDR